MKLHSTLFYIFITIFPVKAKQVDNDIECDGLIFHHVYYDKELIATDLGRPYNLVMHKFSGMLFFSHTIHSGTRIDFGIMVCHLEKKTCNDIKGVPGGYAVAYDSGNDDIFFGGHDGIYKYNFLTRKAEFFAEEGKSIWSIFVKKNFYYIDYPTQRLFVYQDDVFVEVAEAINIEIDNFFISKHFDIYFSNKTALYKVDKGAKTPNVLSDEIVVRQIAEDSYGDIYFCGSDGIYIENKPYHHTKKIADISNAFGMTFDEHDHIIYSDKDSIYRLLPSKHGECFDVVKSVSTRDDVDIIKESLIS